MNDPLPRYFLLAESLQERDEPPTWRFVLCQQKTGRLWTARDHEPGCDASRTAVLALVRGLEALPEPARVTVISSDRHVRYGLEQGLQTWSTSSWKWERFGRLVTVRDDDLWQRVAQTLQIHQVECRSWRVSVTDHSAPLEPVAAETRLGLAPTETSSRSASDAPAFSFEPALLVIRKPRRVLRFDRSPASAESSPAYARASVG